MVKRASIYSAAGQAAAQRRLEDRGQMNRRSKGRAGGGLSGGALPVSPQYVSKGRKGSAPSNVSPQYTAKAKPVPRKGGPGPVLYRQSARPQSRYVPPELSVFNPAAGKRTSGGRPVKVRGY